MNGGGRVSGGVSGVPRGHLMKPGSAPEAGVNGRRAWAANHETRASQPISQFIELARRSCSSFRESKYSAAGEAKDEISRSYQVLTVS